MSIETLKKFHTVIEPALQAGKIPGAAIAVVAGGKLVYARGFGYRDLKARKPVTPDTVYPIASTTKAINATILGMLVEDGLIEWDAPVQRYLPQFRMADAVVSARTTIRDLVTMCTGLPRHDWVWSGTPLSRAELVASLAHLDLSTDFRQRFQYCNLTVTAAGHVAEVVTGKTWEALARERIFKPLGMRRTGFELPAKGNVTLSYHENLRRKLVLTKRRDAESTAPSGGSVHSTVTDMARWVMFNLKGSKLLAKIHAPQVVIGPRPLAGLPAEGAYALGWLADHYNGHKRVSHGGYLHDVNSHVMFFPKAGIGMVSFTNFGPPVLAATINQYAFDALMGLKPEQTLEEQLALYEKKVKDNRQRIASVACEKNTRPSHPLAAYSGQYQHPAYGTIKIALRGRRLVLQRNELRLPLKHWHYDVWVAEDNNRWTIHAPHVFDRASHIQFHVDTRGAIAAVSIPFEPEVAPIRFAKR